MKVIGIIGTHGKTSTLYLIETLLRLSNNNVGMIGDMGIKINNNKIAIRKELLIHDIINEMKNNSIDYLLIELKNTDLIKDVYNDINFDCLVFTEIKEQYSKDIVTNIKRYLTKAEKVIINGDNENNISLFTGIEGIYIISYGLKNKCTVTASSINIDEKINYTFCLQRGIKTFFQKDVEVQEIPIEISVIGYQHLYNSLAAITVALISNISILSIQKMLSSIDNIPGRLELRKTEDYNILYDNTKDYYSIKRLFETTDCIDYNSISLLIGILNGQGEEKNIETVKNIINEISLYNNKSMFYVTGYNEYFSIISEEKKSVISTFKNLNIPFKYENNLNDILKIISKTIDSNDLLIVMGRLSSKAINQITSYL